MTAATARDIFSSVIHSGLGLDAEIRCDREESYTTFEHSEACYVSEYYVIVPFGRAGGFSLDQIEKFRTMSLAGRVTEDGFVITGVDTA